jgi:hypothetical protein
MRVRITIEEPATNRESMKSVRVKGAVLATAFVSSALATTTLSGAPAADATCFSMFGIGNGNGCTSNPLSYALAIGEGATADATTGFFGGAFAAGANARATTTASAFTTAMAVGDNATASAMFSLFSYLGQIGLGATTVIGGPNFALGISDGSGTQSTSVIGGFNILAHQGPGSAAALGGTNLVLGYSGGTGAHTVGVSGLGNVAVQLGPGTTQAIGGLNFALGASPGGSGAQLTIAGLLGTVALNLLGNGHAVAQGMFGGAVNLMGSSSSEMVGVLSTALNILGDGNSVRVIPGALLSVAYGLLSNNVTVTAGPGPLSFSGAILQNGIAVGQALSSAMQDYSARVNGATSVFSQAVAHAMSASSSGDLGSALAALMQLPGAVLNAVLFGYDTDALGSADPAAGLAAAKVDRRQAIVAADEDAESGNEIANTTLPGSPGLDDTNPPVDPTSLSDDESEDGSESVETVETGDDGDHRSDFGEFDSNTESGGAADISEREGNESRSPSTTKKPARSNAGATTDADKSDDRSGSDTGGKHRASPRHAA